VNLRHNGKIKESVCAREDDSVCESGQRETMHGAPPVHLMLAWEKRRQPESCLADREALCPCWWP
jgi:hypothetical protein